MRPYAAGYGADLAHIHHAGFTAGLRAAAPALLALLARAVPPGGLVIDLACGSGVWAGLLLEAGYRVLGVDTSPDLLALARREAPGAEFREGSLFREPLPACHAVTALGEGVGYLFDPAGAAGLGLLAERVAAALPPGGVFLFDVVEPGAATPAGPTFAEGEGWTVFADRRVEPETGVLARRIVTFRRLPGGTWRRSEEVHRVQLYQAAEAAALVRRAGFRARVRRSWGADAPLLPGRAAILARRVRGCRG